MSSALDIWSLATERTQEVERSALPLGSAKTFPLRVDKRDLVTITTWPYREM